MTITEEQVGRVAKLLKLSFPEEELADFTNQLDRIIGTVELLEEVDTTEAPFTSNVSESINVMHEDIATSGMGRRELMRNVPESKNGYIKVSAIMDNGKAGA